MKLGSISDIIDIRISRDIVYRRVNSATWNYTRNSFKHLHGLILPSWGRLSDFGNRSDLVIIHEPFTISIFFRNRTVYRYQFRAGFITDLGSVPKYFRSLIDNDDIDILAGALCHDRNFSTHVLTFEQTNELFYKMIMDRFDAPESRDNYLPIPIRAKIAWLAVSSIFGKIFWRRNKRRKHWTELTSTFDIEIAPTGDK